jgi:hypothetical protein
MRTLIVLLLLLPLYSQGQLSDSTRFQTGLNEDKKVRFLVLPGITFSPETSWYFGLGGISYFKLSQDSATRPSDVRFNLAHTLNKQVIAYLPFSLWTKDNLYWISGQVAFYRYPYFFRGIGNGNPSYTYEDYTASFPRIRLSVNRRFGNYFFTGPVYWFQDTKVLEVESGGLLDTDSIAGADGSLISNFGWQFIFDSRNKLFAPTKGFYGTLRSMQADASIGSDYFYRTLDVNLRYYLGLKQAKAGVLAFNVYTSLQDGNPPFNQMSNLGGQHFLRGYRLGHFRDRKLIGGQLEYRSAYRYGFGFTLFAGTGTVASTFNDFSTQYMRSAVGGGIRFILDQTSGLNLRFDYARRKGAGEFYFAIGEAF